MDFRFNKIKALPKEIGNLSNLKRLHLSSNMIEVLPSEIGLLDSLETLWFDANLLTLLPPEIGNLQSLDDLEIKGNLLTTLPPEISQLPSIIRVSLDGNNISTLPIEVYQFPPLAFMFSIGGNKLWDVPDTIAAWLDSEDPDWRESQRCGSFVKDYNCSNKLDKMVLKYDYVNKNLVIEFDEPSKMREVSIFTSRGSLVNKITTSKSIASIPASKLKGGMYYIVIKSDGSSYVRKFFL